MPLVPLLPLFHSLNREYFAGSLTIGTQPKLNLRWSDGKLRKTAGLYRRGLNVKGPLGSEIVLSKPLLKHLPQTALESTLCHEMIHAWIDLVLRLDEGHGPNFHARMNAINATQNKFKVSVRHSFPVPTSPVRWWAECPCCGLRIPYKRIVRGAACKQCCDTHHGGQWHSSCLLAYESAS